MIKHTRILLSFTVFVLFGATSCVRDYTCQCTVTYSGAPGLPDSSIQQYSVRDTKAKAKSACEGKSGNYTTGSISMKEKCILY